MTPHRPSRFAFSNLSSQSDEFDQSFPRLIQSKSINRMNHISILARRGVDVSNDEMLGFAKLFNDELTLDNINRSRLVNMFILAITTHQILNGSNRSHFVQSLEVGSEDFSGKVDEEDSEGRKALQIVCEYGKLQSSSNGNKSGTLFTCGEDRAITAWDTNSAKLAYSIEDAHPARIKGIVVLTRNDSDDSL